MTDIFTEIRTRVPLAKVFALYGLHPNRARYIGCPFHAEKTGSLKVYADHWFCFGCHAKGDAVTLVSRMDGLSPIDAARKLDRAFSLGLFSDKPLTPAERRRIQQATAKHAEDKALAIGFEDWWRRAWLTALWHQRWLKSEHERLRPHSMDDHLSDEFSHVLREAGRVEYLLDELMKTNRKEQVSVFSILRNEVKHIESIRNSREVAGTPA
ncbi:MAG: hypothetical protein LBI19_02835 [Oscillospiraceae bacterium]|jgi:hypothetical protein|nr:hypothetical protein [Oscillospiraceae bacterium]